VQNPAPTSWRAALHRAGRALLPSRGTVRRSPWSLLVPLVALLAGLLFSMTAHAAQGTALRDDRNPQLSSLIQDRQRQIDQQSKIAAGLRNQVEGCILQTLSRTLHEEVTFDRSRVTSVDWESYPILRFPEAPAVEVILIDRPDQPLLGAGEAATAPVAAAVANAVFDATGVRLREVPFTPERVKRALAAAGTA